MGKDVDEELIREVEEVGHSNTEGAVFERSSLDPSNLYAGLDTLGSNAYCNLLYHRLTWE